MPRSDKRWVALQQYPGLFPLLSCVPLFCLVPLSLVPGIVSGEYALGDLGVDVIWVPGDGVRGWLVAISWLVYFFGWVLGPHIPLVAVDGDGLTIHLPWRRINWQDVVLVRWYHDGRSGRVIMTTKTGEVVLTRKNYLSALPNPALNAEFAVVDWYWRHWKWRHGR